VIETPAVSVVTMEIVRSLPPLDILDEEASSRVR
jgi:hypothetical protein